MPALRLDDGTVIAETSVICKYLEELHPVPALIGTSATERTCSRMWLRRVELNITENIYGGFRYAEGPNAGHSYYHPANAREAPKWPLPTYCRTIEELLNHDIKTQTPAQGLRRIPQETRPQSRRLLDPLWSYPVGRLSLRIGERRADSFKAAYSATFERRHIRRRAQGGKREVSRFRFLASGDSPPEAREGAGPN